MSSQLESKQSISLEISHWAGTLEKKFFALVHNDEIAETTFDDAAHEAAAGLTGASNY